MLLHKGTGSLPFVFHWMCPGTWKDSDSLLVAPVHEGLANLLHVTNKGYWHGSQLPPLASVLVRPDPRVIVPGISVAPTWELLSCQGSCSLQGSRESTSECGGRCALQPVSAPSLPFSPLFPLYYYGKVLA